METDRGIPMLTLTVFDWHLGVQPMMLKGALLATLLMNFPRAKHFLCDCGTMLLSRF